MSIDKIRRTEALLKNFERNADEFEMLKGVLCMSHGLTWDDRKVVAPAFDNIMIARRMDEINAAFQADREKQIGNRA